MMLSEFQLHHVDPRVLLTMIVRVSTSDMNSKITNISAKQNLH